jgi:hypothetical protein
MRNHYGTGNDKYAGTKGLRARHARGSLGAASTLAAFLAETHHDRLSAATPRAPQRYSS